MLVDQVNDAMRTAAEDAKNAQKSGHKLKLPLQHAADAAKGLTKALTAYEAVKDEDHFEMHAFKGEVERAERALDALRAASGH
jgi:hypothetical protein